MRYRMRGATLIELMTVVIVIAILAAIGLPSYRRYVMRAQRNEAMRALLRVQTAQEKHFLQHNVFATDLTGTPPEGLGMPELTESGYYRLAFSAATTTTYRATATAIAGQRDDESCAVFAIDHGGVREAQDRGGADHREQCWR
jgi:type IV pilus assembly protein PilE